MTIEPEIQARPWPPHGTNGATAEAAVLAPDVAAPRRTGPASSSTTTPDYRLRGLDLETAALAVVGVVLRLAVVQPYAVKTTAMVPTLHPDTSVLVMTSPLFTGSADRG